MVGISLTAKQAQSIVPFVEAITPNEKLWIFSYLEHIDIEVEHTENLIPIFRARIFEDGEVKIQPLDELL